MKIAISGYGKMGHMIESILVERGIEYVASEDITSFSIFRRSHSLLK